MPSLTALNNALSGLRIATSNISLISTNISNVNTEGYTRKTQQQETQILQGRGAGARAGDVQRAVDGFLQREMRDQVGAAGYLEIRSKYLQQIQEFHGPAESEFAISNKMGTLKESFQALANTPGEQHLLNQVYQESLEMANSFNDFATLITRMRNDAQTEMSQIVTNINSLSEQIAELNLQIKSSSAVGRTTADLEDQRDNAVNDLAEYVDISYFERGDKVLVVQTQSGTPLVENIARKLYFTPTTIGPSMSYPASVAAIRIDDPTTGVNITDQTNLGGQLGALVELRDTTLPTYQAQIDEMAYRTAERFNALGLRLFTLNDGSIPPDDGNQAPPFGYVSFATGMQVNPQIANDLTLIRSGTSGNTVPEGSAEQVRKIVDFAFGELLEERGVGTVDITGLTSARVIGNVNIQNLATLDADANINPPGQNTFSIALGAGAPQNIVIGAGDTASDLVNTINGIHAGLAALDSNGQLVLSSNQDITIADVNITGAGLTALGLAAGATTVAGEDVLFNELNINAQARIVGSQNIVSMGNLGAGSDYINPGANDSFILTVGTFSPETITIGAGDTASDLVNTINGFFPGVASLGPEGNLVFTSSETITIANDTLNPSGLAELGITTGTTNPTNPNFIIQLGNFAPVTIEITETDTATNLLAKINAISGITATTDVNGFLQIDPDEGGDIVLTDGIGSPLAAMGVSETQISHTAFNSTNLGTGSNLSTGLASPTTLLEYATQTVSKQSQDATNTDSLKESEQVYRDTLQTRLQNESGVNIDEEMAALVQLQNNYAAASKAIQVIDELFQTLLQSVLQ